MSWMTGPDGMEMSTKVKAKGKRLLEQGCQSKAAGARDCRSEAAGARLPERSCRSQMAGVNNADSETGLEDELLERFKGDEQQESRRRRRRPWQRK